MQKINLRNFQFANSLLYPSVRSMVILHVLGCLVTFFTQV